ARRHRHHRDAVRHGARRLDVGRDLRSDGLLSRRIPERDRLESAERVDRALPPPPIHRGARPGVRRRITVRPTLRWEVDRLRRFAAEDRLYFCRVRHATDAICDSDAIDSMEPLRRVIWIKTP